VLIRVSMRLRTRRRHPIHYRAQHHLRPLSLHLSPALHPGPLRPRVSATLGHCSTSGDGARWPWPSDLPPPPLMAHRLSVPPRFDCRSPSRIWKFWTVNLILNGMNVLIVNLNKLELFELYEFNCFGCEFNSKWNEFNFWNIWTMNCLNC
jgi:hypothetical protein